VAGGLGERRGHVLSMPHARLGPVRVARRPDKDLFTVAIGRCRMGA
jgi:hypothetical protein